MPERCRFDVPEVVVHAFGLMCRRCTKLLRISNNKLQLIYLENNEKTTKKDTGNLMKTFLSWSSAFVDALLSLLLALCAQFALIPALWEWAGNTPGSILGFGSWEGVL